jgi:hypothetical protein
MDLERDEISGPCQAGWTGRGNSSLSSLQEFSATTSVFGVFIVLNPRTCFPDRSAAFEQTINKGV